MRTDRRLEGGRRKAGYEFPRLLPMATSPSPGGLSSSRRGLPAPIPIPTLLPHPVSSVARPWVLHHPLVGFLNLFTLLLIVPAITPLNEPSVSCQDPSQVNLGEMLENLQCLLAS